MVTESSEKKIEETKKQRTNTQRKILTAKGQRAVSWTAGHGKTKDDKEEGHSTLRHRRRSKSVGKERGQ